MGLRRRRPHDVHDATDRPGPLRPESRADTSRAPSGTRPTSPSFSSRRFHRSSSRGWRRSTIETRRVPGLLREGRVGRSRDRRRGASTSRPQGTSARPARFPGGSLGHRPVLHPARQFNCQPASVSSVVQLS
jgi:hypothetical protein